MMREKKTSKGRQRIEMKKIENVEARYISFSKRRLGVFGKASELSTLCGADVAVLICSPAGKLYSYGSPSVDQVVDRFLSGGLQVPPSSSSHQEQARRMQAVQDLNQQAMELSRQLQAAKARKAELREWLAAAAVGGPDFGWVESLDGLGLEELDRLKESMERLEARVNARAKEILRCTLAEAMAVDRAGSPWLGRISSVNSGGGLDTSYFGSGELMGAHQFSSNPVHNPMYQLIEPASLQPNPPIENTYLTDKNGLFEGF